MIRSLLAASALAAAAPAAALAQPQGDPVRSITPVAGDVYRFQNNQHFGVFMVSPEGIVVVDPINTGAAEWLRGELASRFDVPVTHVAYSHHHWDHASGGAAFGETAAFVGHEDMVTNLDPLQGDDAPEDVRFQYTDVRGPDVTFAEDHEITVGGKTVELIHVGGAHASDMTFAYFPEEKVLFVVDVISLERLPFMNLPGYDEADMAMIFDAAQAIDAEIVVPGHGDIGGPEDVAAFRQYYADLQAGVQAGVDAGQSLEEIQESLLLADYADWGAYEQWRPLNIAGMHAYLTRED